ncbi:membrane protein insertion efficiency factor YidD [Leucobacter sp. NPDC015123]|uniref:membrane protein insertion efficiency factor YidD n=1 Tax=Leucobacter sp. NPDC015123 TaxID=3364129 RepID=UPI0036F45E6F
MRKRLLLELWLLPRNGAIAIMKLYRRVISPLYGEVCRYYPSCSRYSMEAYQQRGFLTGLALTIWRLLRCNPFSAGGIDDVPQRRAMYFDINSSGFVRPRIRKA